MVTSADSPVVTVIMAAFNSADYISEAIDSVLSQTMGRLELIIVDDGSTDATARIVERYSHDKRVQLIEIPNSGSPTARNVGIKKASAPYIAFIDSDDLWPTYKLERQLAVIKVYSGVAVLGAVQRFTVDGNGDKKFQYISYPPQYKNSESYLNELLSVDLFQMSCFNTILAPTAIIQQFGLWDPSFVTAHDWENWLRLSQTIEFKSIPEPLYFYRKHKASTTRKNRHTKALHFQFKVIDKYSKNGIKGFFKARCYKSLRYEPFIYAYIDSGQRGRATLLLLSSILYSNFILTRAGLRAFRKIILG
jgi:glycosyltransferase involved in cell wall biosynthesis